MFTTPNQEAGSTRFGQECRGSGREQQGNQSPPMGLSRWVAYSVLGLATLLLVGCADQQLGGSGASETQVAADESIAAETTINNSETDREAEGSDDGELTASTASNSSTEDLFPDVIAAEATQDDDGTWTFAVTISSPYDSPDRYADAWRVEGPDGEVYDVRELAHDHASEQPFTRSKSGIEIPAEVTEVTVMGRDQQSGWGGETVTVTLG